MTSPFFYDAKRTLTSKAVLASMAVLILLSILSFPSFIGNATQGGPSTNQVFAYYDTSGYHFLALSWNTFGQPMGGTRFDINVSIPGSGIPSGIGVTGPNGTARVTIAVPDSSGYTIGVKVTEANGTITSDGLYAPLGGGVSPGQTVPVFRETRSAPASTPTVVGDLSNTSARDILVAWVGPNGTVPTGYHVYSDYVNNGQGQPCEAGAFVSVCPATAGGPETLSELNGSNAQLLGTMDTYVQVFHAPALNEGALNASSSDIAVGLAYPSGASVPGSAYLLPTTQVYPSVSTALKSSQDNQVAVSFFDDIFGLVIPLLAVVTTHNTYGKDRVSGVLESVLVQPVTRRELSLSRYLSSFTGMAVAVVASAAVLDLVAEHFSQSFVEPSIIISSTVALLAELAVFIGIMMMLSQLVKSSGTLIGLGVGIFFVIDFFQGLLDQVITSGLGLTVGSAGFFRMMIGLEFANPAQLVSLVNTYLTGIYRMAFLGVTTGSFPVTPSALGITLITVSLDGAMWVLVPFCVFLYLAVRRD